MSAPAYDRAVFRWNGSVVSFMPGDSVAAALYRSGIRTLASTRKRHLPLGFSGTYVQGVLGRVDGRPNVRLDLEPAVIGLEVSAQNTWPGPRFDILRWARILPSRWLRSGFEHPRIFPGGTRRFQLWERLLQHLAGVAEPPAENMAVDAPLGRRIDVDVLVVGGGPAAGRLPTRPPPPDIVLPLRAAVPCPAHMHVQWLCRFLRSIRAWKSSQASKCSASIGRARSPQARRTTNGLAQRCSRCGS
jgi:hypothetical protein